jgi:hypothetical protein
MAEAADQAELDPDRLSFTRALNIVRRQVTAQAAFPPSRLKHAAADAITEILERPNPRDATAPASAPSNAAAENTRPNAPPTTSPGTTGHPKSGATHQPP